MTATRCISSLFVLSLFASVSQGSNFPETLNTLFENHCMDCHDGAEAEGRLNLLSLDWNLKDPHLTGVWVKIHDRLPSGQMPPKEVSHLDAAERRAAVKDLASGIIQVAGEELRATRSCGLAACESFRIQEHPSRSPAQSSPQDCGSVTPGRLGPWLPQSG